MFVIIYQLCGNFKMFVFIIIKRVIFFFYYNFSVNVVFTYTPKDNTNAFCCILCTLRVLLTR